jgi:hypothetical protein
MITIATLKGGLMTKAANVAARVIIIAMTVFLPACAPSKTTDSPPGTALTGSWGGDHIVLDLTPVGGAVEYDCAHGGLLEPVRPGSTGQFEAAGVHVREHGGPIREGERVDTLRARFVGRVDGDRMTLRVFTGDRPDTLGSFELHRGQDGRVFKCL